MATAKELIEEKKSIDAPICMYENLPVQKGTGRFGPFIKWNNMFINVSKKYNFDNLSQEDVNNLIDDKKQKELAKLINEWPEQGIRLEKARWGRFNLIKGKIKIELPKSTNSDKFTLEEAQALFEKKSSKTKKTIKKKAFAKKK